MTQPVHDSDYGLLSEIQPLLNSGGSEIEQRNFTFRAVVAGLLIGILINLSNMYYGLQTGSSQQMPIVSALLGFLGFSLLSKLGFAPLSKAENVLIASVATATGCMPVTAGFAELIPALEYVLEPSDGGPIHLRWTEMFLWSLGLCFFGILFAALLRERLVVPRDLPWPGATASSNVIRAFYAGGAKTDVQHQDSRKIACTAVGEEEQPEPPKGADESRGKLHLMLSSAACSGFITIIMYFIPISRNLPVFGSLAADKWLWTFTLSPGFFGSGMIMGPEITLHMLTGAIVGWAILSPYAKSQGWAPGPVEDWDYGSRGWIVWISLAGLIADALVKMAWICVYPLWRRYGEKLARLLDCFKKRQHHGHQRASSYSSIQDTVSHGANSMNSDEEGVTSGQENYFQELDDMTSPKPDFSATPTVLVVGFIISILVCVLATHQVFGLKVPWHYVLLSVLLALPMAVIAIRSLGESDYNPQSGLVSQLIFASFTPRSNPDGIILNIVSAAIATAGASQTGDLAYDFKIGQLVGAAPKAQIYGQIVGSIFGALVSCATYRLYTSQFPIPGSFLQIPSSFLQVNTAKLVLGRGLPEGVAEFALGFGLFFAFATMVKMRYANRWWQTFIPSGVSFAVGIYLLPSFTLSRTLGGIFTWVWILRLPSKKSSIELIGSGLILGESIASLGDLAFTAMNVPQFGPK